ncbi:MAG: phage late control D family protein [Planctomycetes bacterium]|nr:phage late control D family protein [Planctomycetota bacterium]
MASEHTPKFELLVNGAAAPSALVESVITLRAHQDLDMSDCLELRLSNPSLDWTESDALAEGTTIKVKLGYEETSIGLAFQGTIVRRDCQFPVRGPAIVTVVAYDKEHQLKHGRHNKAWLDMKDSAIASAIAGAAGLSGDVKDSKVVQRYVVQHDQTHLGFLRERARRLGYEVHVDRENKKLYFGPPTAKAALCTITWEVDLFSFSPRMSTAGQATKVQVRGWDMTKKVKIFAEAASKKASVQLNGSDLGAKLAEKAHGSRVVLYPGTPLFETGEADALVLARLDNLASKYSQANGTCQGNFKIEPGKVLDIQGVGERASGEYYVDRVLHHFQPGLGYSTHFQVHRASERIPQPEPEPLPKYVPSREEAPREEAHYVEFNIRPTSGESVDGWNYTVTLPGGKKETGTLDETGIIRVEGIRDPDDVSIEIVHPDDQNPPA